MSELRTKKQPDRYEPDVVCQAIIKARGIRAIAGQYLGCTRQTVSNYVKRYKACRDAEVEAKSTLTDYVENKLIKNIDMGKEASIFFYLKTQAKDRGYIERSEVSGIDGEPVKIILEAVSANHKSTN